MSADKTSSDRQRTATTFVPEPTTILLLGSGIVGIAAKLRKRRNRKNEEV